MNEKSEAGPRAGVLARDRKAEHLKLALEGRAQHGGNFFEAYYFEHEALPEIDLDTVDTSAMFLGKPLRAPLLISCMTGGTEEAGRINRNLAAGAEAVQIALGVGSQRKAIENPDQAGTFQVRDQAPSIPLLANLGAVQLNYGFGLAECRRAVDMIEADALVFHLNALQEAIQPEGDRNFSNLLPKMGAIAEQLSVPVIAKEVGCGVSETTARALAECGIRTIDTAGLGGTSWARIEAQRARDLELGELFANWGIPTPESIQQVSRVPGVKVIGSGGVRNGLDIAKALALGADWVGMASPFLEVAVDSADAVIAKAERMIRELKIAMFCLGVQTIEELKHVDICERS